MSLLQATVSGVRWSAFSMVVVIVVQFIRIIVLGRILGPDAFGLMAMLIVVIGLADMINQLGLSDAIVQHENPTRKELSSLFWLNVIFGVVLFLVLLASRSLIAKFFSAPELSELLAWFSIVFLIAPWGNQPRALMRRNLEFKTLTLIEVISVVIGAVFTVWLALAGNGVWSLVWGYVVQLALTTILLLYVSWRRNRAPELTFGFSSVRPYLPFGINLLGSNLVGFFVQRADQLLIGTLLGSVSLGYYSMAFNIALQPIAKLDPAVTKVAFPVLVKVRGDRERMKRGYLQMLKLLASVNAPLLLGAAVLAPVLVPTLIGEKWVPIVPILQISALTSLLLSQGNAGGSLVLAAGRADWELHWNLVLLLFVPISVFFGAKFGGLIGVAYTLLALQFLLYFGWYALVVRRIVGKCLGGYLAALFVPLSFAIAEALVVYVVINQMAAYPAPIKLIVAVIVGGVVYVSLYFLLQKEFAIEQLNRLTRRSVS